MTEERVGIIGGGMLGMTLAKRLQAAGMRTTVLEAAAEPGGLAATQAIGDFKWDKFYHVILRSDSELLGLLRELGLDNRIRWAYTRSGCYSDGALLSLSTTLDFLRFPPLRLVDKARLAATILHASRLRDWRPLEAETAADWLRRWSGRRAYERLWLPLLRSKLGENAGRASAAFIWAIIARMYAARRSGLKREMFGYVDGGYATVLRRFAESLTAAGVELACGRPTTHVTALPDGVGVTFADGTRRQFDRVVLTVPCRQVAALCPDLRPDEHARLRSVVYQGIVCPSLLLRRPLAGYYITSITDAWVPFTAVIEMTALVDPAQFGGGSLVYLPRYLSQDSPLWEVSDESIVQEFTAGLARMYPGLEERDVVAWQVGRAREVLALSTLHYSRDSLPPTDTSIPRVHVVNSAQIAAGTLNVNETVALANRKAAELTAALRPAGSDAQLQETR